MFERFTDRARRVIVLAQEEARLLNHSYIGTEHLLLGLIMEGEGTAAQALSALGVTVEGARQETERIAGTGPMPPPAHMPFTPRAKRVLELGLRESLAGGVGYIGTEHLLLGLMHLEEGVGLEVLAGLGVEAGDVRREVSELTAGPAAAPTTPLEDGPDARAEGPVCAHCGANLLETVAYRTVSVPEALGGSFMEVMLLFCTGCGQTVAALRP